MKKLILLPLFLFIILGRSSFAGDGSSGCGVGWMVLKDNSLISSFTRTFINATFSNTIAMTLGTSGCTKHSIVLNEKKGLHFTEANMEQLMVEIAQGQGKYLEAYAQVFGCEDSSYGNFSGTLKRNYQAIFPSDKVSAKEVLNNVRNLLKRNSPAGENCGQRII